MPYVPSTRVPLTARIVKALGRLPEPVTARELMTRLGIENRNSIWSALGNLNRARLVYRLTLGWPRETTWAIVRSRINPEALPMTASEEFDRDSGPRYAAELDKAADLLAGYCPAGQVKALGRLEVVAAIEQLIEHHKLKPLGESSGDRDRFRNANFTITEGAD